MLTTKICPIETDVVERRVKVLMRGVVWQVGSGMEGFDRTGRVWAWQVRYDLVWYGKARLGQAGAEWLVSVRKDEAWQMWRDGARHGTEGSGWI